MSKASQGMSNNLSLHLNTQAPLIWVVSDEPRRVASATIAATSRPVVRGDMLVGAEQWSVESEQWLQVLVPDPENPGEMRPPEGLEEVLNYTAKIKGILLMENAHLIAEKMVGFLTYNARKWLDVFYTDDADAMGATIIMISCKDEVPPEVSRSIVKVIWDLPNATDVEEIYDYIIDTAGLPHPSVDEMPRLVRAGVGLSEFELIQAANEAIVADGGLTMEHVLESKLAKLKTDGLLEVRVPSVTVEQIGGLDNAKKLLAQTDWIWRHPTEAAEMFVKPVRSVLLIGITGTGKSLFCEAAATMLGLELIKFGASAMMTKWLGESEQNMRRAFRMINAMSPLCLWTEELGRDLSGGSSSGMTDGGTTSRVHGEFLTGMQELPDDVFWVSSTNDISQLPPEMLRAGRMDRIMFAGLPSLSERVDVFRIHLGKNHAEFDLDTLASRTAGFTPAEIKALISDTRFIVAGDEHRGITTADVVKMIPHQKTRVMITHLDVVEQLYRRAKAEWMWASSEQEADADEVLDVIKHRRGATKSTPVTKPTSRSVPNIAGNAFSTLGN